MKNFSNLDVSVTNTNNNTTAEYSEWSIVCYCSVKCGGGIRIRLLQCLKNKCDSNDLVEQQTCGNLLCVAGKLIFVHTLV